MLQKGIVRMFFHRLLQMGKDCIFMKSFGHIDQEWYFAVLFQKWSDFPGKVKYHRSPDTGFGKDEVSGCTQFFGFGQIDTYGRFGNRIRTALCDPTLFGMQRHHSRMQSGDTMSQRCSQSVSISFGTQHGISQSSGSDDKLF